MERPKGPIGNIIYIPVLATGVAVTGLILGNAHQSRESSEPLRPIILTPVARQLYDCSVTDTKLPIEVSRLKKVMGVLSKDPNLGIDFDNGIPRLWSVSEGGDWYAKPTIVPAGGTSELRIAINHSSFARDLTEEECLEAQNQLRKAIEIYQSLSLER